MSSNSTYLEIVSGRAGAWAAPLRWGLSVLSLGYGSLIRRRNARFDVGHHLPASLPVPVISVGNLTVGGTGKTPLVIDLATRLAGRGFCPGVVARGYGAKTGGRNDELTLIERRLGHVRCIADTDRVRGARRAIAEGADAIVLDDGFQHRWIGRDLDIVVIDATLPFGFGRLLPAGVLREPVDSLRRAQLVVISRADQVSPSSLAALRNEIERLAPGRRGVTCRHRSRGIYDLAGVRCDDSYRSAVLFAGIGQPAAFAWTVEDLGIFPVKCLWWPDHHAYGPADLRYIAAEARKVRHDVVLTTEKDAVRLSGLSLDGLEPLRVVSVDIEYLDGGQRVVESCLDAIVERRGSPIAEPLLEVGGA